MNSAETSFAPPSLSKGRSLGFGATFVLLAALTASVAFIPHMGFVALSAIYLGTFLAYMGLRSDPQGGDLFEVIVLLSVLSFLYFCVGTMYLMIDPGALQYPALAPFLWPALALATLGYLSMLVGYGWFFRSTRPSPLGDFIPKSILVYLVPAAIGCLGMSMQRFQSEGMSNEQGISPALSFLQQFGPLFFFGWFLAWYMFWAKRLHPAIAMPVLVTLSGMASIVLYFTSSS